jgi:hypothetical protein
MANNSGWREIGGAAAETNQVARSLEDIVEQVNALPILQIQVERGMSQKQPAYVTNEMVGSQLGSTVLCLFGGADITALKCPKVSNIIIVDSNPFVSKQSITQHCAEEEKDGLFHKDAGLHLLANSPFLYATMRCFSDGPFKLEVQQTTLLAKREKLL